MQSRDAFERKKRLLSATKERTITNRWDKIKTPANSQKLIGVGITSIARTS
jgi:hypothetical protein